MLLTRHGFAVFLPPKGGHNDDDNVEKGATSLQTFVAQWKPKDLKKQQEDCQVFSSSLNIPIFCLIPAAHLKIHQRLSLGFKYTQTTSNHFSKF